MSDSLRNCTHGYGLLSTLLPTRTRVLLLDLSLKSKLTSYVARTLLLSQTPSYLGVYGHLSITAESPFLFMAGSPRTKSSKSAGQLLTCSNDVLFDKLIRAPRAWRLCNNYPLSVLAEDLPP